ncbi:MAG: hypothetical protein P8Y62_03005 [candidate division WOR-3 bacterium]
MKDLKIFILLVVGLSGCSNKYLASREEEFFDRKVLGEWNHMEGRVVSRDEEGFTMGLQIKNFVEIRDSLRLKEVYMRGYEGKDGKIEQNFFFGLIEVLGGCSIMGSCCVAGLKAGYDSPDGVPSASVSACLLPIGIIGFSIMIDGLPQYVKSIKEMPAYVRLDTLCFARKLFAAEKVKIMLGNTGFIKTYYTDGNSNLEVKFDEIISEPAEADSVLSLIIEYEELADTVEVNIIKKEE